MADGQQEALRAKLEQLQEEERKAELRKRRIENAVKAEFKATKRELSSAANADDKYTKLFLRFNTMVRRQAETQVDLEEREKQFTAVEKQKEKLVLQVSQLKETQERLESLCRELHQGKADAEKAKLEVEVAASARYDALVNKYKGTLDDISQRMATAGDDREQFIKMGQMAQYKLLTFMRQAEAREEYVEKTMRASELQIQLEQARYAELEKAYNEDRSKTMELTKQLMMLLQVNEAQEKRIAMYESKFGEYSSVIEKSNELVQTYKSYVEDASTKLGDLEKENARMKTSKVQAELAAVQTAGEMQKLNAKVTKLEQLCRAMQQQNAGHRQTLKGYENAKQVLIELVSDQNGQTMLSVDDIETAFAGEHDPSTLSDNVE